MSNNFLATAARLPEEVVRDLASDLENGLDAKEAQERLKKYGHNRIEGRPLSGWAIYFRQFRSPFIFLLAGAIILSVSLGETIDAGLIALFIFINTTLGFYQEYRSEKVAALLKSYTTSYAKVKRHGKFEAVRTDELVPGDIVLLETGDGIPADLRLVETHNFAADESILTGESVPARKLPARFSEAPRDIFGASNLVFAGTAVVEGRAVCIAVGTGRETYLGSIARLATETKHESGFEKGIASFSRFILKLVILTLCFVMAANLVVKPGRVDWLELLIFAIALAVSVIPEALPVVTTFSLSRGALRLAKRKVVVRRLSAIEDLGSIEILCTDKTGTLTENKLAVQGDFGRERERTLAMAALASSRTEKKITEPFDIAIEACLPAGERHRLDRLEVIDRIPFDPRRRWNAVAVTDKGGRLAIVRGAPESIAVLSRLDAKTARELHGWMVTQGREGRRTLAVAVKEYTGHGELTPEMVERGGFEFIGALSFVDPIKSSTPGAVEEAKNLGIAIKIITGDGPEVAGAVARSIGLVATPDQVITGNDFEALPPDRQIAEAERHTVFARITPEQKHRIVSLLSERHQVGFLGEGINDAPALKAASVSLVVQSASDIAREAADILILKKSLRVIVDGIREGRMVFANTTKYIRATMASNFGNFYAVAIASLFIDFLPMLPIQLLLLNLLSDFPMISIATDSVDPEEVAKPRRYNMKHIMLIATFLGIVSTVFDFMIFGVFFRQPAAVLQTSWFIGSILTELVFVFSIRTHLPWFRARRPSWPLIILTVFAMIITIGLPFTGLGQDVFRFAVPTKSALLTVGLIVLSYFAATEAVKLIYYRNVGARAGFKA